MSPAEALAVARKWHGDQHDKLGEDYVDGHLRRVQRAVAAGGGDITAQVAAALHDTLEDTGATAEALAADGVPDDAIRLIEALTRATSESYEAFIDRIARHPDLRAVSVKLADLRDNSDPERNAALAQRDPATAKRLARRYADAIARLEAVSRGRARNQ